MSNILTVPTLWYFNCPQQCAMFLLFQQFDILTVTDNVESLMEQINTTLTEQINTTLTNNYNKYHTVGTVRTLHIVGDS
jgi:hypothetical protein